MPESIQNGGSGRHHWSNAGPGLKDYDHAHALRVHEETSKLEGPITDHLNDKRKIEEDNKKVEGLKRDEEDAVNSVAAEKDSKSVD